MPQRTERFMFNVDLEALDESCQPIDAAFGLSDGAPSSFSALGPIVRFNPEGRIDVRNGDVYTADVAFPYQSLDPREDPFDHYHIRMDVDLPSRHHSVWATAPGAAEVEIASNYAFRTEQSALSRIDYVGTFRDSPNGAGFYCGARFSPPVCARSSAGTGFAGQAFPVRTGSFYTEFTATPIAAPIDAVVGLSQGAPSAFSDHWAGFRSPTR
jgi:unsaturated chondroitin disaccharide hydrolase